MKSRLTPRVPESDPAARTTSSRQNQPGLTMRSISPAQPPDPGKPCDVDVCEERGADGEERRRRAGCGPHTAPELGLGPLTTPDLLTSGTVWKISSIPLLALVRWHWLCSTRASELGSWISVSEAGVMQQSHCITAARCTTAMKPPVTVMAPGCGPISDVSDLCLWILFMSEGKRGAQIVEVQSVWIEADRPQDLGSDPKNEITEMSFFQKPPGWLSVFPRQQTEAPAPASTGPLLGALGPVLLTSLQGDITGGCGVFFQLQKGAATSQTKVGSFGSSETAKLKVQLARLQMEAKEKEMDIALVPPFRELEVAPYFCAFERIAMALKWPKEVWPILLQCKLTRKAQEAVYSLSLESSLNYEKVKEGILHTYALVPEAYRQKCRGHKKGGGQTLLDFRQGEESAL
ncbi:hypothetical protein N1851_024261 [Merluccius polli]|uniref:Uncharacterized protein n=1 Tax=Merluccius polli TaxID=89951 RepID=A0AA47MFM8_MERPO|nr:hypothetical protein N1851_024261 [Merluccius polli]